MFRSLTSRLILMLLALTALVLAFVDNPVRDTVKRWLTGQRSVNQVLSIYGDKSRQRWREALQKLGLSYPPQALTLIGIKASRQLELWVKHNEKWLLLKQIPWTAYSGELGPKLRQGDKQIPEGLYRIDALNPNSSFHLSMRVNYPNQFDRHYARIEQRHKPGKNIFIHGKAASVGCIAIGDDAIEDLFVLVVDTGFQDVQVIIAPVDFRRQSLKVPANSPPWLPELYRRIKQALTPFSS